MGSMAWGIAYRGIAFEGGSAIIPTLEDPQQGNAEVIGCLKLPPEGLGMPELRTGDVVTPQRDGVTMTSDFYSNRQITMQVTISGASCDGCLTAKERVYKLLSVWNRRCDSDSDPMIIYTDCHDPDDPENRQIIGPFAVFGRPRVAEVTWRRSNMNVADVLLRFDTFDHKIVVLPEVYREENGGGAGADQVIAASSITVPVDTPTEIPVTGNVCADAVFELIGTLSVTALQGTQVDVEHAGFTNTVTQNDTDLLGETNRLIFTTATGRATFFDPPDVIDWTGRTDGDITSLKLMPATPTDPTVVTLTTANPEDDGFMIVSWYDSVIGI